MSQASEQIASQYVNAGLNRKTWSGIVYNLSAYGAEPGNVTANTAAFSRIFADIQKAGGGEILVPPGTFLVSPLTLPNVPISIVGIPSGFKPGASVLKFSHTNGEPCINLGAGRTKGVSLENIKIEGNPQTGDGIALGSSSTGDAFHSMRNVYVYNVGGHGLNLYNVFVSRFENVATETTGKCGIYGDMVNECRFTGITAEWAKEWGVYIKRGEVNTIEGNANDCNLGGVYIEQGSVNEVNVYYEAHNATQSRVGLKYGVNTINNRSNLYETFLDTHIDLGIGNTFNLPHGTFESDNRKILNNVLNSSFEDSLTNWLTNSTPAATITKDTVGYSGTNSLKVDMPGNAGTPTNVNAYMTGAGYQIDSVAVGDVVYVSFWIKGNRAVTQNGYNGENIKIELINLGDVYPNFYRLIPVTTKWTLVQSVFIAKQAATSVGLRIVGDQLASNLTLNITDLIFTKDLTIKPRKIGGLPTTGTYMKSDVIDYVSPSAGGYRSIVCVTSGRYGSTPPTWKETNSVAP